MSHTKDKTYREPSNLKKDIENVFLQYRAELKQGLNELAGHGTPEEQSATQIINLIESVIPEEIDVKSKYETDDDGGINVVVDENNDTMTGENLVHLARLASDEGYNQAIKDIKSKLIGKE